MTTFAGFLAIAFAVIAFGIGIATRERRAGKAALAWLVVCVVIPVAGWAVMSAVMGQF